MKNILAIFLFIALNNSGLFAQSTCDCWIPLDTSFHIAPMTQGPAAKDIGVAPQYLNDDGSTVPIKLPFNFCFYGQAFDTVYINNNGNISFIKPISAFVPGAFPFGTDTLMIVPFYSDIDTRAGGGSFFGNGTVYYKITPTYMIVKWNAVGYQSFDVDFFNTFQLIITNGTDPILQSGNNVSFCYRDMGWASADVSGGMFGWTGIPATVGINKGNKMDFAQFGQFNFPGASYTGPSSATNGVYWLDNKSFTFNTCIIGNNIPPVIVHAPETTCDTIELLCPWETFSITATAMFLSPVQAQTSILSASYSGLTGFSEINSDTVDGITTITVQAMPSSADAGVHVLNIMATNDRIPPQTSTVSVIVILEDCSMENLSEITTTDNFSIYPNPGNGNFTVQIDDKKLLSNSEVKIYDIFGREMYAKKLDRIFTDIDISDRPKGIYFFKLYNENISIAVKKIITQ